MALPKLNESPKYEIVIPSSQKTVKYRPFLVKEQKVLLMAMETEDQKQILNAITDTIAACVVDPINVTELTTFDVEYVFTQIRSKSVGENAEVNIKCEQCEHANTIKVDLSEIKVDVPKVDKSVQLTDKYTITLRYPKYSSAITSGLLDTETSTEQMYQVVANCLDTLRTEDEIIQFGDESREDVMNFVESLTAEQFEKVMQFIQKIPQLKHEVKFNCEACNHSNSITLQGMQDFFS